MRFTNLDGSGPHPLRDVLKWATRRRRQSPPRADVPSVEVDHAVLSSPPPLGSPARLTWLGHASWLVQLDGCSLVLDPVLGASLSGVVKRNVPAAIEANRLPRIDASLVTHNHRDHLDLRTLREVGARVIAGEGTAPLLRPEGLEATELGWWQAAKVGAVEVTFVPAQHWSGRGLADQNEMLWGGFVIKGQSATLFHSGDTAAFDGFQEIGRRAGPIDAALLPIGAYDPAWFMEAQHMNPEQAVEAFTQLGARHFVAMHWGTFKLTDEPLDEPPRRLAAEWERRRLEPERQHLLPIGAAIEVARGQPVRRLW